MANRMLKQSKTKKLDEFSDREARSWIVDRLVQVELLMDTLIKLYFSPSKNVNDFLKILLHPQVISFGAKAKLLHGCGVLDKKLFESISQMGRIRNAFAHGMLVQHIQISVHAETKLPATINAEHKLAIMNSNGVVKSESADKLLKIYFDLFMLVADALRRKIVQLNAKAREEKTAVRSEGNNMKIGPADG
jgi:hypothetical protein